MACCRHKTKAISFIVFQLMVFGCALFLALQHSIFDSVDRQNTRTVTAIVTDWETQPFTSISVQENRCEPEDVPVFSRLWGGTEEGCEVENYSFFSSSSYIETMADFKYKHHDRHAIQSGNYNSWGNSFSRSNHRYNGPVCFPIQAEREVEQTQFAGHYFCGQTGGASFLDAERVDPGTQECRGDTVPCSPETSPENTVCVAADAKETDCPITYMEFTDEDPSQAEKSDDGNSTDSSTDTTSDLVVQQLDDGRYFVYSTQRGDNLPITSTRVEFEPCLDPAALSRDPAMEGRENGFYPTEVDGKTGDCAPVEMLEGETHDSRYEDLGLTVSEFEVQDENDVIEILEDQPLYRDYIDFSLKKQIDYSLWGRPTIGWALECELDTPRLEAHTLAAGEMDKVTMDASLVTGFSIALCVIATLPSIFGTCVLFVASNKNFVARIFSGILFVIQGGIGLFVLMRVLGQMTTLDEREAELKDLQVINPCGDEFTQVPDSIFPTLDEARAATSSCVLAAVWLLMITAFNAGNMFVEAKEDDGQSGYEHHGDSEERTHLLH